MESSTRTIRYQQWAEVIREWSASGKSKKRYCMEQGINEEQFYYYQRRIRKMLAQRTAQPGLAEGITGLMSEGEQASGPQIVKLQVGGMRREGTGIVCFGLNGMEFTVPESIPTPFLAKLVEAASHGSR